MKNKFALLLLMVLLFSLGGQTLVKATDPVILVSAYSGVDYTNYFADSVLVSTGSITEKTTAASDTATSLSLAQSDGSLILIGFDEPFDGFGMDVDTSASNGSYSLKYWDGSAWTSLQSTKSAAIKNSSSTGTFMETWDRPSSWDARTMEIDTDEDGTSSTSENLYFVKLEVENDYDNAAKIGQIGLLDYNLVLNVEDELGDELVTGVEDFDFASIGNETIFAHKLESSSHYFAFHSFGSSYSYTINPSGYVTYDDTTTVNKSKVIGSPTLDFTHKITAIDSDDGSNVDITSAKAGTSNVSCTIDNGDAYCPVETDDDSSTATIYADDYNSESFTLPNRTSDDSSQKLSSIEMTYSHGYGADTGPDLTITDLSMDNDDLIVKVENEGDTDVGSEDDAYLYIYVDGDNESSYKVDSSYLDAYETLNVTFTLSALNNLDHQVEVEACIDVTDNVDEDNEDNNCRTEDFGTNDSNDQEDFEITDIYVEDDDLYYTVENTGDKDASGTIKVEATVDQDNDEDTLVTKSYSSSTSSNDFFDAGEETTYNLGNLLDDYYDDGSDFDVTICVDTDEDFDEESESNNCMTVDDSQLDDGPNSESCGNFTDTDGHWAEEYICNLFDRDVVHGRTTTKFYPDYSITRAEFLKMTLLGLDYDTYATSGVYYSDVQSDDWAYEYISYATTHDIVDGYDDNTFRPDQYITRGEAIVLLLRAAEQEDYSFSASDIDFWDVDTDDWFAWAVVVGDEAGIINGYSDDSFRPAEALSRAEASVLVDLSYQEYIQ